MHMGVADETEGSSAALDTGQELCLLLARCVSLPVGCFVS